jgi:hypothetical protein
MSVRLQWQERQCRQGHRQLGVLQEGLATLVCDSILVFAEEVKTARVYDAEAAVASASDVPA